MIREPLFIVLTDGTDRATQIDVDITQIYAMKSSAKGGFTYVIASAGGVVPILETREEIKTKIADALKKHQKTEI